MLLDISRLIWRARRTGPTGIDRVELAYAQHFLSADARRPAYAVVHLLGGLFCVNLDAARRFVQLVAARWRGIDATESKLGVFAMYVQLFKGPWSLGFQLRRQINLQPLTPIFLVVSHHHLSREYTLQRLRRSFGVRCVCFLHDLIPIDFPEYFQPHKEQMFWRIARTIYQCFDAAVANSQATATSLRSFQESQPLPILPRLKIYVATPGVMTHPIPNEAGQSPPPANPEPHFVVLGTIEPRKNHLLLLNLWSRLATTMVRPPRLLVIGARGWENEQVVDMLERSRRLRGVVDEQNRASDSHVKTLLHNARALLLPSFVEGFGLPIAEALALSVPVICSDIPAFREVGGDVPEYLDPLDLPAWLDAVAEYSRADSPRRAAQIERLAHWQTPLWADHFAIVERVLDEVTAEPRVLP